MVLIEHLCGVVSALTEGPMAETLSYPSVDAVLADAPSEMLKFLIEYEEPGIGILTLNRPQKLNAFTEGLPTDRPRPGGWSTYDRYMRAVTQELKLDPRIRVVVITGAGRAFSAGADIKRWGEMERAAGGRLESASPFQREGLLYDEHTAMLHIWVKHLVKPTIAMVNGPAIGMGADLACACDMRVMAEDAFMQWAYMLHGMVPKDGALWFLPRIVGQAKATEWILTAERVYGPEALAWGLANHVVAQDKLREVTMNLAAKIARHNANAVQYSRYALHVNSQLSFQDAVGLSYISNFARGDETRDKLMRAAEDRS